MEVATGYAFTKKYYSEKTDQHVRTMVSNIKSEMKLQIEKSNWLDDETKKIAIEKLESMELFVGTPDWYKNSTYVLNAYKGVIFFCFFEKLMIFLMYLDSLVEFFMYLAGYWCQSLRQCSKLRKI